MAKFTFIDLFAGIGGFHLGLQRNGGDCLAFSEVAKDAVSAYCANHSSEAYNNLGDIRKIKGLPSHDLLTAGVPCQSWSIAGKNLGFDDDRGQLWNDTIYLLNQSKPKAFIFENVKGLADPRNKDALNYILERIRKCGYFGKAYVLNSYDYGVIQNRIRVYIVGFKNESHFKRFELPIGEVTSDRLYQVLDNIDVKNIPKQKFGSEELFGDFVPLARTRFQRKDEVNDFFLFNDIRNGHSTIHSWDLLDGISLEEEELCYTILKNRRKKKFGVRDGNPLSFDQLKSIDPSIKKRTIKSLVRKEILKEVVYSYDILSKDSLELSHQEDILMALNSNGQIHLDNIYKKSRVLVSKGVKYSSILNLLNDKDVISPSEIRYEFKNSKISSGINGINRIYLPQSEVYSTLVASDTNDFVATQNVQFSNLQHYKEAFIAQIYKPRNYRKISKIEACRIQGFPEDFKLQKNRSRWMKLLGNSVSVPVIEALGKSIVKTGVFDS